VPTSIDVTKYIVGAAEVYYRATDVLTPWTSVGATLDDVVARIGRTLFNPSDSINGIDEMIAGLDYQRAGQAEFEFTLPEMSGPKLALAIPGAVTTTRATTTTGGGGSSTTTAATVVGATTVPFTAVTNFTVGDYFKIDTSTATEYRRITAIAALNVSFRDPLLQAHASGVAVVEVDGDGKTVVTASTVRRQPLTAYYDWALVAQSPADYYEIIIHRGISTTESVEFTFGDETLAGIRVTIGARKSGTDLTLPAWEIYAPAA
jgi:hypothetical protein